MYRITKIKKKENGEKEKEEVSHCQISHFVNNIRLDCSDNINLNNCQIPQLLRLIAVPIGYVKFRLTNQ